MLIVIAQSIKLNDIYQMYITGNNHNHNNNNNSNNNNNYNHNNHNFNNHHNTIVSV